MCPVCVTVQSIDKFCNLSCGHSFCKSCWSMHFETQVRKKIAPAGNVFLILKLILKFQISQGISTQIRCMESNCDLMIPEDLVLSLVTKPVLRDRYQHFSFQDYVKSHKELRFCPGLNCQIIIRSHDWLPKKATCKSCNTTFCFRCGLDYHAPTDCQIIKKWLTKCADDSETGKNN